MIPGVGVHALRRANATALILAGVDLKTAQSRLGHSDPRLTLGLHAQVVAEADRAAADALGERFLGTPGAMLGREGTPREQRKDVEATRRPDEDDVRAGLGKLGVDIA